MLRVAEYCRGWSTATILKITPSCCSGNCRTAVLSRFPIPRLSARSIQGLETSRYVYSGVILC